MPFARVDDIIVLPDRQRTTMTEDKKTKLIDSILDRGLLHPIVVRETDEGLVLCAGGRRLAAVTDLFRMGFSLKHQGIPVEYGHIPYTTVGEISELEAEEVEFAENVVREDLSWQDRCSAVNRLHKLRTERAKARGEEHTIADTARIVAQLEQKTELTHKYLADDARQAVLLANHLDDPVVKSARTAKDAFRNLQRAEQQRQNEKLAQVVGATFSAQSHRAFNAECLAWMKSQPAESFDVICTDPPYGIGADDFGDNGGLRETAHEYDDSVEAWVKLMTQACPEIFRLAKPQAHAYLFCDIDRFADLKQFMINAGWAVFRTPLIVYKENGGRVPLPEHGPRRQWEMVLYAIKGHKPVTFIYPDVIPCRGDDNLGHGAQKPVALIQNLLQRSCRPGDTVLDPFAGSGSIFPAAHALKCIATGTEKRSEYYGICLKRLQSLREEDERLKLLTPV